MSKTLTKEMVVRSQEYEDRMDSLRWKLKPYINPVEDAIFGDVAFDLTSNDNNSPEEILDYEEDILDYLDEKNFSKIVSALHELFDRQKSIYLKDEEDYDEYDYVDEDGNHYSTQTQTGESYELYGYI